MSKWEKTDFVLHVIHMAIQIFLLVLEIMIFNK